MEPSKFIESLIEKARAMGYRVEVTADGRVAPEGKGAMSDKDFAHWVSEQEKKK